MTNDDNRSCITRVAVVLLKLETTKITWNMILRHNFIFTWFEYLRHETMWHEWEKSTKQNSCNGALGVAI